MRKAVLDDIGGFADVPAPDTYVQDMALKLGYRVRTTSKSSAYHIREVTLKKAVKSQLSAGVARYIQGKGFLRTLLHSLARLRPFVLVGYFYGMLTFRRNPQAAGNAGPGASQR